MPLKLRQTGARRNWRLAGKNRAWHLQSVSVTFALPAGKADSMIVEKQDMQQWKPGALIFDCDGTLVDSAPVYLRAWASGLASSGKTLDETWYRERYGFSEEVLMRAFEQVHGVTLNYASVVQRMREAYFENMDALAEYPAVTAIVRREYGRIPLAVASGGPGLIVRASLAHLDLSHFFDSIVTLDEVGVPKPAPDLFLHAAECLGVPPENCLVFEDTDTGLTAAQAAGMRCIDVREGVSDW